MREGACIGGATMPQPWTLRLTRNAAALAAASPTLLFRPLSNAARLKLQLCFLKETKKCLRTSSANDRSKYKAMDGKRVARSGAGGLLVEGRGVGGTVVSVLLLGASGPLLVRALIRPPFSVPCVCV